MTRSDAIIAAVTTILHQRRRMLTDVALRGLYLEAKLEKDGTVRVVLVTPRFVKGGGALRGAVMLDLAVSAALEERRALLDDVELRAVAVDALLERDGRARVFLFPTYARQTAEVGLRRAVAHE